MDHTGLKRAAPLGTDWWRCPDCQAEGALSALMRQPCTAAARQPQEEALVQAVGGVGKYAPIDRPPLTKDLTHCEWHFTPPGWRRLKSAEVYVGPDGDLTITGTPDDVWPDMVDADDEHPHDCDFAGCGWEHVIGRGSVVSLDKVVGAPAARKA